MSNVDVVIVGAGFAGIYALHKFRSLGLTTRAEILRHLNWVVDELDLRDGITFNTRVTSAVFDETDMRSTVSTDTGESVSARFCVMATGPLSAALTPDFPGLSTFEGEVYHTAHWPKEPVNFTGKRVAVIGTGSSGIQSIPIIAEQAEKLVVFQRTPNYSVPAGNRAGPHSRSGGNSAACCSRKPSATR